MIATCTKCQARYQLENAKIPSRIIKVRCPACAGVFALDGTLANEDEGIQFENNAFEPSAPFQAPESVQSAAVVDETPAVTFPAEHEPVAEPVAEADPEPVAGPMAGPRVEPIVESQTQPVAAPATAGVATLDEPAPALSSGRRRRCKEEMLARALVSDILVYNRETRDAGLAEGNLLEVLGGEIKKSWELYKEKVTPEVANSTTYFREALNDILADGDQVF